MQIRKQAGAKRSTPRDGDSMMIGAVVENIIGGYLHPRASVRRLLNAGHGLDVALTMLALAFLVREIMLTVTPGALPEPSAQSLGPSLGRYGYDLFNVVLSFAVVATLICYIGRAFGGRGSLIQSALVLAWYEIVTSVIFPIMRVSLQRMVEAVQAAGPDLTEPVAMPAGPAMILLIGGGISLWLFAAYVAELHGFKRTLRTLAVIFGLSIPFSMIATALLPFA